MENNHKDALDAVTDLAKQEISLATGALFVSGTFMRESFLRQGWLMRATVLTSWAVLVLSVFAGLWLLGRGAVLRNDGSCDIYDRDLNILAWVQRICFAIGLVLFILFVTLAGG